MTSITGISHVSLTVSDLDRSQAWYERVLHASTMFRARVDVYGFECAYLAEPSSGIVIGLTQHDDATNARTFDAKTTGLDHLSLAVSERAELETWAAHLEATGVAHNGVVDQPFGTGLEFKDPDGIALEFYHFVMPSA